MRTILILTAASVLILVSAFSLWTYRRLQTDAHCLAAGYAWSTLDGKLRGYCLAGNTATPVEVAIAIER